jgi:Na+/melibiose symporter-like transporter
VGRTWKDWLKEPTFYIHGCVYMLVRVAVNVTMTMQPFFLTIVTKFPATEENPTPVELALVPLISYVISLIFSLFIQQPMTRALRNRFLPMLIAILTLIVTSAPLAFLNKDNQNWVYPLAGFQGVGLAIMLNTATSMISDVIGNDSENSAFVYGCYSLFDKFANGAILLWMLA